MNMPATTVAVHYRNVDGYHLFTSQEVKGLYVGGSNLEKVFEDVSSVIEVLMLANHKVACKVTPLMTFAEFLDAATDGKQTKADAETRTFTLQMAA